MARRINRKNGNGKRTSGQIVKDRALIADLYCKGYPQSKIREEVGRLHYDDPTALSIHTINADIHAIRKEWLQSSIRSFDELQAKELAKLDHLERTYWEAWERSVGEAKTVIERRKRNRDGNGNGNGRGRPKLTEQVIKSETYAGDPRFLDGVQKCIERRCKILGLEAPQKHAVAGRLEHSGTVKVEAVLADLLDKLPPDVAVPLRARLAELVDAERERLLEQAKEQNASPGIDEVVVDLVTNPDPNNGKIQRRRTR